MIRVVRGTLTSNNDRAISLRFTQSSIQQQDNKQHHTHPHFSSICSRKKHTCTVMLGLSICCLYKEASLDTNGKYNYWLSCTSAYYGNSIKVSTANFRLSLITPWPQSEWHNWFSTVVWKQHEERVNSGSRKANNVISRLDQSKITHLMLKQFSPRFSLTQTLWLYFVLITWLHYCRAKQSSVWFCNWKA